MKTKLLVTMLGLLASWSAFSATACDCECTCSSDVTTTVTNVAPDVAKPPDVTPDVTVVTTPKPTPSVPTTSSSDLQSIDKVRFVGNGGDNKKDGKTHATRWATTENARGLPTGTDVYVLAGSDQGPRDWDINWSGTESDRAVIGCYFMDGKKAVSCEDGPKNLVKPIIRGTYAESCRPPDDKFNGARYSVPSTCPFNNKNAIPKGPFDGLIQINNQKFVTVQDLQILDSSGSGVVINEGDKVASQNIIQRLYIAQIVTRAFNLADAADNSRVIFRDNVARYSTRRVVDGIARGSACIVTVSKHREVRALFENNVLIDCGGEGFNTLRSKYNIYRGNIIAHTRNTAMYMDNSSYNVYENNLIIGGGWLGRDYAHGAQMASLAVEAYDEVDTPLEKRRTASALGNVFRNNIGVNMASGFAFMLQVESKFNCENCINPSKEGYKLGGYYYGNSLYSREPKRANDDYIAAYKFYIDGVSNLDELIITNNLFAGHSTCTGDGGAAKNPAFSMGNNLYQRAPTAAACKGAGDEYNSVPSILQFPLNENAYDFLTADYKLKPEKMKLFELAGYNKTKPVPSSLPTLKVADYPQVADFSVCKVAAKDWVKPLTFDFYCNPRDKGRPGAIEFKSTGNDVSSVEVDLIPPPVPAPEPEPPVVIGEVSKPEPTPAPAPESNSKLAKRWNPGHYAQLLRNKETFKFADRKKYYDSIKDNDNIVGVWVPFYWHHARAPEASLEGDKRGDFQMQNVKRDLDYLDSIGKKMVLKMMDMDFGNVDGEPEKVNTRYPKYILDAGLTYQGSNSVIWCRWDKTAMDAYIDVYREIAKNFDNHPALEAVILYKESAPSLPKDGSKPCGFTMDKYYQTTERMISEVAPMFKKTNVLFSLNYMGGSSQSVSDKVVKDLERLGVGITGPDTLPPVCVKPGVADGTNGYKSFMGKSGGKDYRGIIPSMWSVENSEMGGDRVAKKGSPIGWCIPEELGPFLNDELKASHVGWDMNVRGTAEQKWKPAVLNYINDPKNKVVNTQCPSVYKNGCE